MQYNSYACQECPIVRDKTASFNSALRSAEDHALEDEEPGSCAGTPLEMTRRRAVPFLLSVQLGVWMSQLFVAGVMLSLS